MSDPPKYPTRGSHFGIRVCRLLHKTCAAQEIGPIGTLLVTFVALQEDACRYKKPVTFYDGQLMPILGVTSQATITAARRKAVEAGWLVYLRGWKGKASTYWVAVPSVANGLEDAPIAEDADPSFDQDSVQKMNRNAIESRSNQDRNAIESRSKVDGYLPNPIPNPKETHTGASQNESTETVPTHPYVDWISAERDFLQFWGDSSHTCRVSYIPAEYMPAFQARWSDDEWRSDAPRAIARLASSQFWSGRKVTLKQFLEPLFVTNLLSGGYEDANRTAGTGAGPGRSGKPLPPHITAGKHGLPTNPNDPF
jgi:hypothetical protein